MNDDPYSDSVNDTIIPIAYVMALGSVVMEMVERDWYRKGYVRAFVV